jgi:acetyl esterase
MARDRGGPALVHQLLVYPVIDKDFGTKSYRQNGGGAYLLTKDMMVWFWDLYRRNEADAKNPYAAPLQAKNLKGVAPALVQTAEFDPLRDEGEAYGQRLKQAGVPTVVTRYDGLFHGYLSMLPAIERAKQGLAEINATLATAFAAGGKR